MSLGLEIAIEKLSETVREVRYAFFVREGRGGSVVARATGGVGVLSIDKASGDTHLEQRAAV